MKRFWKRAEAVEQGGRFVVLLDGRPVRLPGGAALGVASRPLAAAVAAEWGDAGSAEGGDFSHEDLPLTRLVGTAEERIAPDPAPTIAALVRYGGSDLLCYRGEDPRLAERQTAAWNPLLDWSALTLDAPLRIATGVMPVTQEAAALAAIGRAVAAHPPLEVAALGVAVPALGSVVLGLALSAGRLEAAEAVALSLLEERFQQEFWGLDSEAEARQRQVAADVALAARLLALARA
jgi:chaperone required for assembly of F1-ATPase